MEDADTDDVVIDFSEMKDVEDAAEIDFSETVGDAVIDLGEMDDAESEDAVIDFSEMEETDIDEVLELADLDESQSEDGDAESEVEADEIFLNLSDLEEPDDEPELDVSSESVEESTDTTELDTPEISEEEFDVVITEDDDDKESEPSSESLTSMDPVLFEIYYEESTGRLKFVEELLIEHDAGTQPLVANKDLIRAFHTLYGSARTAEIEEIAEICGATEKYIKAREEAEDVTIPEEAVSIVRDVTSTTRSMIDGIKFGVAQQSDIELLERIHVALQEELQSQLQETVETSKTEDDSEADEEITESSAAVEPEVEPRPQVDAAADVQDEDEDGIEIVRPAYEDIDEDLIDIFIEEAEELLESCESTIIVLEGNSEDKEASLVLQRDMHTLKGGARMAELKPVGDLTHVLESLVIEFDSGKIKADKRFFEILHESVDNLNDMMTSVRNRTELKYSVYLLSNIEALLRGEEFVKPTVEQRTVERFDIEIDELERGEEEVVLSEEEVASVEKSITESERIKGAVKDPGEEEKPAHWGERASDTNYKESQDQVRVRADLLNTLVNSAGEVNIFHARMGKQVSDIGFNLSELEQTVIRLREQLRSLEIETEIQIRSSHEKESDRYGQDFDPLEMDRYSNIQQLSRSLGETASDVQSIKDILSEIVRDSETLLLQESRVSTELQEGLMRTRMVRFGGLSSRMRRIVRQTAKELDKDVELEITGDTIEVDRKVLDNIVAPLEHMLRNAVAHGIEDKQDRMASSKNTVGTIKIDIGRTGSEIIIKVEDDGAGMNVNAIRNKAIQQGLLTKDSDLGDQDVLQFILKAGFSTAESVSQIAGRGVGMDVVDSEIKQLGGLLEIETKTGKGSKFIITLPVTLAINQALLVATGDDVYAIPLSSIEGVVRITGHELQSFYDSNQGVYEFNGIEYELKHMGNLMTGRQGNYGNQYQLFPVLLAKVGDHYFALHVDELIERREIVVKPVGHQLGMVRGISGATILADGRVVLIIEMAALVVGEALFRNVETDEDIEYAPAKSVDSEKTIMIVDDSITIRKVTSRMLERNGINVVMAKDGVDATNSLLETIPDLMLLDIEMPRMDGFELATYMRNDDRLKDIPIIMITSRTGEKHKEKAFSIGVNAFLGKPYQEEELMKNINEILVN